MSYGTTSSNTCPKWMTYTRLLTCWLYCSTHSTRPFFRPVVPEDITNKPTTRTRPLIPISRIRSNIITAELRDRSWRGPLFLGSRSSGTTIQPWQEHNTEVDGPLAAPSAASAASGCVGSEGHLWSGRRSAPPQPPPPLDQWYIKDTSSVRAAVRPLRRPRLLRPVFIAGCEGPLR